MLGPTASGKSRLALAIAERTGGEVISVDAIKVYRELDIGTAKPNPQECKRVPHHGINLVAADEEFSVARFLDFVEPVLAELTGRGVMPVLDCTAPFYLKALVYGIDRGPEPDSALRAELESRQSSELHAELTLKDPDAAARIQPADQKRIVRALEIIKNSDRLASEAESWNEPRSDYRWVFTGIHWPREILYERVEKRAREMFKAGWLDEVKRIRSGPGFSRTAGSAHGYRRLLQHLAGESTYEEAVERTIADVKQFARKSMTFFRSFPRVHWLEVGAEDEIDRAAIYLALEMNQVLEVWRRTLPPTQA